MDDVNDSQSEAQGPRFYEQVRVVDDMNNSRLRDLRPLDAMYSSTLWMMSIILSLNPKVLNVINNSGV